MTRLESRLREQRFAVTAEIVPPRAATAEQLLAEAERLRGAVDAINVTDAAAGRATMSSTAAAAILAAAGHEPVMQLTCRDRNRIALAGELLGAAAQGIGNVLALTGDDLDRREAPDAKAVFDLDALGLIELAASLARGRLPSGRAIDPKPSFLIGAADVPRRPGTGPDCTALRAKIDAGARFVQTQLCFDAALARDYISWLRDQGLTERAAILLGTGPIASARSARWMSANLGGVSVSDDILRRLAAARDPKAEGVAICTELAAAFRVIPGVAGVHLMAPGQGTAAIAEVLARMSARHTAG